MVTYAEAKKQLEIARNNEIPKAIEKIRSLMDEYEITLDDLRAQFKGDKRLSAGKPKPKPKPKYIYMKDGVGYTGVGRRPAWVDAVLRSGEYLENYRIAGNAPKPAVKKTVAAKAAASKKLATKKKPVAKKKPVERTAATRTKPKAKTAKTRAGKAAS